MYSTEGAPLVVDAGPGTSLSGIYRARVFQSDDRLVAALCRPDQQLGSPPASLATAGRMNARGVSVFYGANDPRVAIAEVRPPVGSQVAVARFEIVRPLRLLDLTALRTVSEGGSIFDPELASRMERAMFLRSLSQRLTRPVMPDDEDFDYLPTQAIADFLATQNQPTIDGIMFPSVQVAGDALNVVLFYKAALVGTIELPKGTEIKAKTGQMYEEGWETEYAVIEEVPPRPASHETPTEDDGWPDFATPFVAGGPLTPIFGNRRCRSISSPLRCMWCSGSSSTPSSTMFVVPDGKSTSRTSERLPAGYLHTAYRCVAATWSGFQEVKGISEPFWIQIGRSSAGDGGSDHRARRSCRFGRCVRREARLLVGSARLLQDSTPAA